MRALTQENNRGFLQLRTAVAEIVHRIDKALPELKEPIKMVVAGGVAVNFYTGARLTIDVDASFSRRIALPEDLVVPYEAQDGKILSVHLDRNYNSTFALLHQNFEDDALPVEGPEFENRNIKLFLLSPVDLAVSKLSRYQGPDAEDIASLAKEKLINPKALVERAEEALSYYVGDASRLRSNLREAVKVVEAVQRDLGSENKGCENGR